MEIILKKGGADTFIINDTVYYRGFVTIARGRFPDKYNIDVVNDTAYMFEDVFYTDFKDGDNGDTAFDSPAALDEWIEVNTSRLLPNARPFRLVSAATTNATLIKAGKSLLRHLSVINTAEATAYVKIYDKATAPDAADEPVLTFPVVPKTEDTPIDLVQFPLQFINGIGIRITGAIADADETAIAADVVFVNAMYQ